MQENPFVAATFRGTGVGWWDDSFTRLLLDAIPADCGQLVEYGCGLARSAFSLLPALPDTHYIGVESDAELLKKAEEGLKSERFVKRVSLRLTRENDIPVADEMTDIVLCIMKLQHCGEVPALLEEMQRILKKGGKLVAVEPDNLGQRFYFNGVLEEINQRMHTLCLRARVARQPADIAIGPRLPWLMQARGYHGVRVAAHLVGSYRLEGAKDFCARLDKICDKTAKMADLGEQSNEVANCKDAIRRFMFSDMPKRLGYTSHTVPVFLCTGSR